MSATTIKLHEETKHDLDSFREYRNESYDDVIKKMIFIIRKVKKQPKLSKEAVIAIENARERIRKGNFVSEEEAKKRLGF
jgi:predicted transcriptional regulator